MLTRFFVWLLRPVILRILYDEESIPEEELLIELGLKPLNEAMPTNRSKLSQRLHK
jgi:hypothetical protein